MFLQKADLPYCRTIHFVTIYTGVYIEQYGIYCNTGGF